MPRDAVDERLSVRKRNGAEAEDSGKTREGEDIQSALGKRHRRRRSDDHDAVSQTEYPTAQVHRRRSEGAIRNPLLFLRSPRTLSALAYDPGRTFPGRDACRARGHAEAQAAARETLQLTRQLCFTKGSDPFSNNLLEHGTT